MKLIYFEDHGVVGTDYVSDFTFDNGISFTSKADKETVDSASWPAWERMTHDRSEAEKHGISNQEFTEAYTLYFG